jgi:transposase
MDYLDDKAVTRLQQQSLIGAQGLLREKIDILFFDATTLYFESFAEDELRAKGFSKDNKFNQTQILLTIFVTSAGIPVGYDIFPGSTYEGHTLCKALEQLKSRFAINNVVFVADSGMLNANSLRMLEAQGYKYIIGARIKTMCKDVQTEILDKSAYQPLNSEGDDGLLRTISLPNNKRLVVTHSSKRAYKDAKDREIAIAKLKKQLQKSCNPKAMIKNSGYHKYLKIEGESAVVFDEDKLSSAANWDGLHGVITNDLELNALDVLKQYKGLWQVEETFRLAKHNLQIRPIYHWTAPRIKAHIAICFMALCCMRHLEYRVNLQQRKMSPEVIRKVLNGVSVTLVRHIKDNRVIAIPDAITDDAKIIYKTFDKTLSDTPYLV